GVGNTANGVNALQGNTTGGGNTASGLNALYSNTGSNNTAVGDSAGFNLSTGEGNVCIGQGGQGVAGANKTTLVRNVHASVASNRPVYVDVDGKLGTLMSSSRYKQGIKRMEGISEAILALKPVTFRYKQQLDPARTLQFGLVAEEVAKVN